VDDVNSFDDQYLDSRGVYLLLEALDYFINRPEDMWKDVDLPTRQLWGPYRVLRGRLMSQLGIRMFDTSHHWLEEQMREERTKALLAYRRRMEELLAADPQPTKNRMREALGIVYEELHAVRFSQPRPREDEWDRSIRIRDRTREPFGPGNWRESQTGYRSEGRDETG
jgi:hypothetical protein